MKRFKTLAAIAMTGVLVIGSVFSSGAATALKVTKNGDYPGFATFTQGYGSSTLSGNTVANSWSGFSITLPGTPTVETSGDGTDWYYDSEGIGSIRCSYFPLSQFGSGDITSFINGIVANGSRQFMGGALVSATPVTLGSLSFYQLSRADACPWGTYYDYCYVREVPGKGYVQVLVIDNDTTGDTLNNVVSTIA